LSPAKPNKPAVLAIGALLSLVASIALAAAVDIAHQKVRTSSEIETYWGVPVLVDIPEIVTDADVVEARKKKKVFAAYSAGLFAMYAVCLYVVYWKHSFILQQLDPVIQRFVYR
jgi:hypothetical protein